MHRFALVGGFVAAMVVDVHASPCGGSDSSDDSFSSFDDDDDDDYATASPSVPSGPLPRLILEFGVGLRRFSSPLRVRNGSLSHEGESFSYRVVNGRPDAFDTALVGNMRVGFPMKYGFYSAVELEGGEVASHSTSTEMTTSGMRGTPSLEQNGVTLFGAALVFGARAKLGDLSLGVEAAGGFQALSYSHESRYGACETTSDLIVAGGLLEGRVRAAYFATPSVTLGFTGGRSMLDDAWMSGIYVGWQTRP